MSEVDHEGANYRPGASSGRKLPAKRTPGQRLSDRELLAWLRVRGYTHRQMVAKLNERNEAQGRGYTLTLGGIQKDIDEIDREWRDSMNASAEQSRSRELSKLAEIEREAWEAWEKSKQDSVVKYMEETGGDGEGEKAKRGAKKKSMRQQSSAGDPQYLRLAMEASKHRREMLGLDAPTRQEVSGPNGQPVPNVNVNFQTAIPITVMNDEQCAEVLRRYLDVKTESDEPLTPLALPGDAQETAK